MIAESGAALVMSLRESRNLDSESWDFQGLSTAAKGNRLRHSPEEGSPERLQIVALDGFPVSVKTREKRRIYESTRCVAVVFSITFFL
jgi:hypothetical protein